MNWNECLAVFRLALPAKIGETTVLRLIKERLRDVLH